MANINATEVTIKMESDGSFVVTSDTGDKKTFTKEQLINALEETVFQFRHNIIRLGLAGGQNRQQVQQVRPPQQTSQQQRGNDYMQGISPQQQPRSAATHHNGGLGAPIVQSNENINGGLPVGLFE